MQFPVTPGDHRNLKECIKWWLNMHSQEYAQCRPGHIYASTEELVLREGLAMPASFDEMGSIPDMRRGRCFDNAWEVSQLNHRYVYCEGWACMDHGMPDHHHGWLYDTWNHKVEDPTWRRMYVTRRAEYPGETWTGCGVYWGVLVHQLDHLNWGAKTGYPNLLSVYDRDYPEVLQRGTGAFSSRPAIDHQPPVVL